MVEAGDEPTRLKKTTMKDVKLTQLLACIEAAVLGKDFSSSNKELNDAHWALSRYASFEGRDIISTFRLVHEYLIDPFLGVDYRINWGNVPKFYVNNPSNPVNWIELYNFELTDEHPLCESLMAVLDNMSYQDISCPAPLLIEGLDTSSPTMWRGLIGRLWEIKNEVVSDFTNFVESAEYKAAAAEFWAKVEERANYLNNNPQKIYYARGAGGGGGSVYEEWSSTLLTVAANKAGYVRTSSDEDDIGISYATRYYLTHPSLVKGAIKERGLRTGQTNMYTDILLQEA